MAELTRTVGVSWRRRATARRSTATCGGGWCTRAGRCRGSSSSRAAGHALAQPGRGEAAPLRRLHARPRRRHPPLRGSGRTDRGRRPRDQRPLGVLPPAHERCPDRADRVRRRRPPRPPRHRARRVIPPPLGNRRRPQGPCPGSDPAGDPCWRVREGRGRATRSRRAPRGRAPPRSRGTRARRTSRRRALDQLLERRELCLERTAVPRVGRERDLGEVQRLDRLARRRVRRRPLGDRVGPARERAQLGPDRARRHAVELRRRLERNQPTYSSRRPGRHTSFLLGARPGSSRSDAGSSISRINVCCDLPSFIPRTVSVSTYCTASRIRVSSELIRSRPWIGSS